MNDLTMMLSRYWWVLAVRGVGAILFGIAAFLWPDLTLAILVMLLGAYILFDGIIGIVDSIRYRETLSNWWLLLIEGLLGAAIGAITLLMPGITAYVLLMFVAAWSIVGGVLRIAAAIRLRDHIQGEWLLVAGGLLSILFGLALIVMPHAGILSLTWLIGFWAIVVGVVFIFLALRLRKVGKEGQ
ncbi:uncharacterized membrane protein HdeD (DUF308 family) [Litoreibacter halocynthiae]|uniref:Uncharacterized membrane protein HdeD (DUF308 family) n=1 Tax=Litoreibacter halocynthiae TaxID=1242689 RepID=A0A4R7LUR2_9RHOB|nr:HdeD family acid-resistance protein [Litoreibacter halocynthiae]TDT77980.1 uncharacterized membrane protein HdeD (DUF308 family) [Litoreibacter halocynthiae]